MKVNGIPSGEQAGPSTSNHQDSVIGHANKSSHILGKFSGTSMSRIRIIHLE